MTGIGLTQHVFNVAGKATNGTAQQKVDALRWILSFKPTPALFMAAAVLVTCPEGVAEVAPKVAKALIPNHAPTAA